jgi:hypothetical protein
MPATATSIARNEVGAALTDVISRDVVKRDGPWITTKLWCNSFSPGYVEPGVAAGAFATSTCAFSTGLLPSRRAPIRLHRPNQLATKPNGILATCRAAAKLIGLGLIPRLGVSNFTIALLDPAIHEPSRAGVRGCDRAVGNRRFRPTSGKQTIESPHWDMQMPDAHSYQSTRGSGGLSASAARMRCSSAATF